mmetsp:Transcript_10493/g.30023  ORF Transcript_10493/g.30023 Transcript_10493/m.30023 type:complete len:337 (-) Transcript_10493:1117-2127(-)
MLRRGPRIRLVFRKARFLHGSGTEPEGSLALLLRLLVNLVVNFDGAGGGHDCLGSHLARRPLSLVLLFRRHLRYLDGVLGHCKSCLAVGDALCSVGSSGLDHRSELGGWRLRRQVRLEGGARELGRLRHAQGWRTSVVLRRRPRSTRRLALVSTASVATLLPVPALRWTTSSPVLWRATGWRSRCPHFLSAAFPAPLPTIIAPPWPTSAWTRELAVGVPASVVPASRSITPAVVRASSGFLAAPVRPPVPFMPWKGIASSPGPWSIGPVWTGPSWQRPWLPTAPGVPVSGSLVCSMRASLPGTALSPLRWTARPLCRCGVAGSALSASPIPLLPRR